ncbi:protein NO VEIN domain-containing protein [Kribbella qitaiheensis]|uniref:protein NO VEIN domain-containing protein n=1 Tax=Kribbella qitaiheensis TaxID=1544730 RepID=UPI00360D37E3
MTRKPTEHQLRAAIRVARLIDTSGNQQDDVSLGFRMTSTLGQHSPDALLAAEALLMSAGLLTTLNGTVHATPQLRQFVDLDDDDELLRIFSELLVADAADARAETGAAGEDHITEMLRRDLDHFGRPDLAAKVQRVSLLSDRLGYDVQAPMLVGHGLRRLEVKTQRSPQPGTMQFFITRHEYEVGKKYSSEWALVMCSIATGTDEVKIEGWCRAAALPAYLPDDRNSRWTEARVRLPTTLLIEGYPPAV